MHITLRRKGQYGLLQEREPEPIGNGFGCGSVRTHHLYRCAWNLGKWIPSVHGSEWTPYGGLRIDSPVEGISQVEGPECLQDERRKL